MRKLSFLIFFTAIWCLWNESVRIQTIFVGMLLSIGTYILLKFLHVPERNHQKKIDYFLTPKTIFLYVVVTFRKIYESSFYLIIKIIKGNLEPRIFKIDNHISNIWQQALVANAITLTPGTVTLDMADDDMTILCLCNETEEKKAHKTGMVEEYESFMEVKKEC